MKIYKFMDSKKRQASLVVVAYSLPGAVQTMKDRGYLLDGYDSVAMDEIDLIEPEPVAPKLEVVKDDTPA